MLMSVLCFAGATLATYISHASFSPPDDRKKPESDRCFSDHHQQQQDIRNENNISRFSPIFLQSGSQHSDALHNRRIQHFQIDIY